MLARTYFACYAQEFKPFVGPSIPMDYESSGGMTGGGRTTIISKDMISFKERSVVLVRISFISVGRDKVLN